MDEFATQRVANPFGREAMQQGERSSIVVSRNHELRLIYGGLLHEGKEIDGDVEFEMFQQLSGLRSKAQSEGR